MVVAMPRYEAVRSTKENHKQAQRLDNSTINGSTQYSSWDLQPHLYGASAGRPKPAAMGAMVVAIPK
jgi:hypothetical protein